MSRSAAVIRIKPQHFIHVLDNNLNVTRVVRFVSQNVRTLLTS